VLVAQYSPHPFIQPAISCVLCAATIRFATQGSAMQRLTISVNKQLALSFDELIKRKGFRNRSEAFRHLLRKTLQQERLPDHAGRHCVGCLSYTYDNQKPQPAHRLAEFKHRFLNIIISSSLTTVEPTVCMETLVLRGSFDEIASFADAIAAEEEVDGGHLNLVPIDASARTVNRPAQ
jgi:CopG family transcriptional regulator, nickel-responsive regulator